MLAEMETPDLILTEVKLSDAEELNEIENSPDQWECQAVEPEELADSEVRIQQYFKRRGEGEQRRLFAFVAREKGSGIMVGQGSISRTHPVISSLGFGVGKKAISMGFGTQIAERLLKFGFGELGQHRIEANVAINNQACIKVLKKLDMTHEGTIREAIWAQGKWWTEHLYSKLARE